MKTNDNNNDISGDCSQTYWVSRFRLSDLGSGLAFPSTEHGLVNREGFILGSTDTQTIEVLANCCYEGVGLKVMDLAGNIETCQVGDVTAGKKKMKIKLMLMSLAVGMTWFVG